MGLPNINITFTEKGVSAIERSARGIVAIILKDDTPTFTHKTFRRVDEVTEEDFTTENIRYIQDVFKGSPSQVEVHVVGSEALSITDTLTDLSASRFNYLAMPDAEGEVQEEIATFIKSSNDDDNKTFKAVLANKPANHEAIINFTTEGIEVGENTFSASQYTPRIAGILAGLSLTRSATYFVLPEVEGITEISGHDETIDSGELVLINDGEKVKIARAVNSLTESTNGKGDAFKKIKIIEGIHLMKDDIRNTFEDNYVGKYINDYDNKVLFVTAINAYLREIARENVLDRSFENTARISVEAQRDYIDKQGVDMLDLTDQEIKEYNTGSKVFVDANVKFVDAIEDLQLNVFM